MEQVAMTFGPSSTQGLNQKAPNSENNEEEILEFAMLLQGLTINSEQLPINFIDENQNDELSVLLSQITNILESSGEPNLELMMWFKGLTDEQQIEIFQLMPKLITTTIDENYSQNPTLALSAFDSTGNSFLESNSKISAKLETFYQITPKVTTTTIDENSSQNPMLNLSAFNSTENSHQISNSKISDKLEMFYQNSKELLTEKGLLKLDILSNDYSYLNKSANIFSEQEKVVFQNLNQMNRQLQSNLNRPPTEQPLQVESDAKVINLNQMQFQHADLQLNQIKTNVTDQKPMETIVVNQNFTSELENVIIKNLKLPNGISQTNIQLHPQELGQIEVKLVIQNGQITAQIVAETLLGKELLEGQIQQLKQSLTFQGYQVERIDVQQASNSTMDQNLRNEFSFSEQQSSQQNQKEQTFSNQARFSEEAEEFINTLNDTSGIDYTA